MEVHKGLGHGFLEAVYQEALEVVFEEREIPYGRECELALTSKVNHLRKSTVATLSVMAKLFLRSRHWVLWLVNMKGK